MNSDSQRCTRCGEVFEGVNPATVTHICRAVAPLPPEVERASLNEKNRFGQYILVDKLGQGGMGAVYKAWDTPLSRYCAIKRIIPDLESNASLHEQRERFLREAHTAAKLSHPNIVQIYGIGTVEETPFIAMEYVVGGNLKDYLQRAQAAAEPLPERLWIMVDVIRAVGHAHCQGIVHRDLKPENIFLTRIGDKPVPKVGDFGLAKEIGSSRRITMSGTALGTPYYMSPEQAEGSRDLDQRSDIFSLGTLLYEAATGTEPFQGTGALEIMRAVCDKEPVAPRIRNPAIGADLETVILKALEKDPRRRYGNAEELAADLVCALTDEPIKAKPPTMLSRLTKTIRKQRVAAVSLALTAAVLLTVLIVVLVLTERKHDRSDEYIERATEAFEGEEWDTALEYYIKYLELVRNDREAKTRKEICEAMIAGVSARLVREKTEAERRRDRLQEAVTIATKGWMIVAEVRTEMYKRNANMAGVWRRIDAAVTELNRSIAVEPTALAHFHRGRILLLQFSHERAMEDFLRALELDPSFAEAAVFLGLCRMGRFAEVALDPGLADEESMAAAREDLLVAREDFEQLDRTAIGNEYRSYKDLLNALVFFADQDYESCVAMLIRGYETWRNEEFLFWAAIARIRQNRTEEAVIFVRQGLEQRPQYAEMYLLLGSLAEDPVERLLTYTRAIDIHPRFHLAYINRGDALKKRGDLDEALVDFSVAVILHPDSIHPLLHRAGVREMMNDSSGALEDLDNARALAGSARWCARVLKERAALKLRLKDLKGAPVDVDESLALHATSSAYALRAEIREGSGDFAGAVEDWKRGMELDPAGAEKYLQRIQRAEARMKGLQ